MPYIFVKRPPIRIQNVKAWPRCQVISFDTFNKFEKQQTASLESLSLGPKFWMLHNTTNFKSAFMKIRHWKDIYQRIFISHILSRNRDKGYSPIIFWVWYVEGYKIIIFGIYKFLYPILSYILFRKKVTILGYFCLTKCIFFVKYRNKLWISSFKLHI
jgi:hypothetical protein